MYIKVQATDKQALLNKIAEMLELPYVNASFGKLENGDFYVEATDTQDAPIS